jgi:hypothetical protein
LTIELGGWIRIQLTLTLFRAKFVAYLKSAWREGKLGFHGKLQHLAQCANFTMWLKRITQREWVVYAKPPFGGAQQVLKYLARYTTAWPSPTGA